MQQQHNSEGAASAAPVPMAACFGCGGTMPFSQTEGPCPHCGKNYVRVWRGLWVQHATRPTMLMHNLNRPLRERLKSRKLGAGGSAGLYRWTPTEPGTGRGFYSGDDELVMGDATFSLRLEYADPYGRVKYTADEYGDTTFTPVIARLPHTRGFLAGWIMGANMAGSLSGTIWRDEDDARRAAREDARISAERELEYQIAERANEIDSDEDAEEQDA